jgi:hypothetical protein
MVTLAGPRLDTGKGFVAVVKNLWLQRKARNIVVLSVTEMILKPKRSFMRL